MTQILILCKPIAFKLFMIFASNFPNDPTDKWEIIVKFRKIYGQLMDKWITNIYTNLFF